MGIANFLSKLLRKKRQADLNQSINQSGINQSIKELPEKIPESIEVEKDSLQLGIAAGYTGRSIKEIESSLNRIESQMVTKNWFISKYDDQTPNLIEILNEHESNEQKRFEIIQNILDSLSKTAKKAPEPVRTELFEHIKVIEGQFPLTPRMQELISVVKEQNEISYSDLASRLGITESALRGLLSLTIRRTNKIKRLNKFGKGWVRYLGD